MSEVEVGDVVFARGATGNYYAVVRGVRLNRLIVDRCDGKPAAPLSGRDVVSVFKEAARPRPDVLPGGRKRPTSQLKFDLS
ncbi:MAG TPA: hypothetical protein VNT22_10355 [Baekduia sp.]|nr:hypothetical protein [Baekduia sp.]